MHARPSLPWMTVLGLALLFGCATDQEAPRAPPGAAKPGTAAQPLGAGSGGQPLKGGSAWTAAGPMVIPRWVHRATLLPSGKVLVTGGTNGDAAVELYDPATDTWSSLAPMSLARSSHTSTLLPSGKVLVTGGSQ